MSNIIKYQFRGELDKNLLAKNMEADRTPIVVVKYENESNFEIFVLKKFKRNYKGSTNLPLTALSLSTTGFNVERSNEKLLVADRLYACNFSRFLSNIQAIIKSHEQATLPVTKVIGVETTANF